MNKYCFEQKKDDVFSSNAIGCTDYGFDISLIQLQYLIEPILRRQFVYQLE